jgi:hypothetical protein
MIALAGEILVAPIVLEANVLVAEANVLAAEANVLVAVVSVPEEVARDLEQEVSAAQVVIGMP